MRFGAAFWVNRTGWPALRDGCLAAERAGWDSIWVDDHLLADEGDPADPKLEGWATSVALAVVTERVRLGLLVGANTFRNPGLTAKLATTTDHLSNGRVVLGLGGGWFEREHDAFGIDFGSGFGERLDRLDEAVGLIRRLLDGECVTHIGRFYTMRDALCAPRPVQSRLPILIGGSGPEQDATDDRPVRGPVERLRPARTDRRDQRDPARALCRGRPTVRADRADGHHRRRPARHRRGTHGRLGRDRADPRSGGPVGSDGHPRGMTVGGPTADVAGYVARLRAIGIAEVIFTFRAPFDLETIERVGELRARGGLRPRDHPQILSITCLTTV